MVYFRSIAVGTKSGYKLFSLGSVDKLDSIYENGKFCLFVLLTVRMFTITYVKLKLVCIHQ